MLSTDACTQGCHKQAGLRMADLYKEVLNTVEHMSDVNVTLDVASMSRDSFIAHGISTWYKQMLFIGGQDSISRRLGKLYDENVDVLVQSTYMQGMFSMGMEMEDFMIDCEASPLGRREEMRRSMRQYWRSKSELLPWQWDAIHT